MKCSPKCRTKKLGMIYTILGSFCSFLNWKWTIVQPQIRPRKIPAGSEFVVANTLAKRKNLEPNGKVLARK